jgi:hypothetical protein
MSRIVEHEYVEDTTPAVAEHRPFYTTPIAMALAAFAVILLLWLLVAGMTGDSGGSTSNQPTRTAPAQSGDETGGGAGGDQTGGGGDVPGGGGANTGNGGNSNSGADGGVQGGNTGGQ